jgi:hypothetical protein
MLYQGTTLVVPQVLGSTMGFSPCGTLFERTNLRRVRPSGRTPKLNDAWL